MFRPSGALLRVIRVSLSRLSSSSPSSSTTSLRSLLATRPLLTNCITYGLLYSGSELIQQTLMKKVLADEPAEYDFGGIFRYWVVGTFQFPVILFYWYRWLDSRFVGTAAKTLAKKIGSGPVPDLPSHPGRLLCLHVPDG